MKLIYILLKKITIEILELYITIEIFKIKYFNV